MQATRFVSIASLIAIAACSSSGGGSNSTSLDATPDTTVTNEDVETSLTVAWLNDVEISNETVVFDGQDSDEESSVTLTVSEKSDGSRVIGPQVTTRSTTYPFEFSASDGADTIFIGEDALFLSRTTRSDDDDFIWTLIDEHDLDYATFGAWAVKAENDELDDRTGAFYVGVPTPVLDMPTTGTATYNIESAAHEMRAGVASDTPTILNGQLSADFGTLAVDGALSNGVTGSLLIEVTFTDLTINEAGFSGGQTTGKIGATDLTGEASGSFLGPQASEVAGIFLVSSPDDVIVGGFGGGRAE